MSTQDKENGKRLKKQRSKVDMKGKGKERGTSGDGLRVEHLNYKVRLCSSCNIRNALKACYSV